MAMAKWFEKRTASVRLDGYSEQSPVFAFQAEIERMSKVDYQALREVLAIARNQPGMTLGDLHAEYIIRAVV